MKKILFVIVLALITACSPDKVSFESLESGRKQANENAEFNAQVFRANHPEFQGYAIIGAADSTQTSECPQGDGWATLTLLGQDKTTKVPLKCSTASSGIGCLTDADFKTKVYAAQDGNCNSEIPFPIPKIQK